MQKKKHILNNLLFMDSLIALISVLGGGDLIVILAVRNYSFINVFFVKKRIYVFVISNDT